MKKHPNLGPLVNELVRKINDEKMIDLNYKVDKLGQKPETVVDDFLRENKLIK